MRVPQTCHPESFFYLMVGGLEETGVLRFQWYHIHCSRVDPSLRKLDFQCLRWLDPQFSLIKYHLIRLPEEHQLACKHFHIQQVEHDEVF